MNKLLIEVYVPSIGRAFDIFIPHNARVFELLPLISTVVTKLADGLFVPDKVVLCNGDTGKIYNNDMTVSDMQLKNGSRLMLI